MKIKNVKKEIRDNKVFLLAEIDLEHQQKTVSVFFSYPEIFFDHVPENADPFFPIALIAGMYYNENIEILPPVSAKILKKQQLLQDIFVTWHPDIFHRIKVEAISYNPEENLKDSRNATFFSLGVDSFYSLLKHLPENDPNPEQSIDSIIYMKGLELPLSVYSDGQDIPVIESIQKVADHYGLEPIYGETNLRDIFQFDWEDYFFGPGLASTALSLSDGYGCVYIPSSHSYATLFPDPSSPLIDSLWSNTKTYIFHDGAEKERARKITDLIIHDDFAVSNLRVCVENKGGIYNCGKCWKCVRSMITLEIVGKLKEAASFPDRLPKNYNLQLRTYVIDSLEFTKENLKLAREYGRKDIEKKIDKEVRLGKIDIFRSGESNLFLVKELFHYFKTRLIRKIGFLFGKPTRN